jgi:iron complex transport system ATP-binding protein
MRLEIAGLRIEITGTPILHEATCTVTSGEIAGLIGPNGSGKSTLLRAVYHHLRPVAGVVLTEGSDIWRFSAREAARRIAALPQERPMEFEITAWEMVALGRTPHKSSFATESAADRDIVAAALDRVNAAPLAARRFSSLSGGERQRVLMARALAQQTQVLVLDEPTNHLDVRYQLELLGLVRELNLTTLVAMHDLNLAAAYCDQLHVLDRGRLVTSGPPQRVLTGQLLRTVFSVGADIIVNPRTGRPQLSYFPLPAASAVPSDTDNDTVHSAARARPSHKRA